MTSLKNASTRVAPDSTTLDLHHQLTSCTSTQGTPITGSTILQNRNNIISESTLLDTRDTPDSTLSYTEGTSIINSTLLHTEDTPTPDSTSSYTESTSIINSTLLHTEDTPTPGSSIPVTSLSLAHPPCRICQAKGAGVHYGVISCKACKSFFGRCLTRKSDLSCSRNGGCDVSSQRRPCGACRYKKCIKYGMSKRAMKQGRTSYAEKTRSIDEVKKLEIQSRLRADGTLVSSEEHTLEMDKIIRNLTDTHLQHIPEPGRVLDAVDRREGEYLNQRILEDALFGSRNPIGHDQYREIYTETGLDIDGRRDFIQKTIPLMEKFVETFTDMTNCIPGYTKLPKDDQMKLTRASSLQVGCFQYSKWYNADTGILIYPFDLDIVLGFEEVMKYSNKLDLHERIISQIIRIQRLDLTEEESLMVSALCLMYADGEISLAGQKIVSASVDYLLEAVQHLIQQNHDPEDFTLTKIILIITELRSLEEFQKDFNENFIEDGQGLDVPQFFKDLYEK